MKSAAVPAMSISLYATADEGFARHKHTWQRVQGFRRTAGTVTFARTKIAQESASARKVEKAR
jgi:hypothetical protein